MSRSRVSRPLLFVATLCAALTAAWFSSHLELAYYVLRARLSDSAGLRLSQYRVVIDGQKIEGIAANTSGLTYNPHTGTLFTVINHPPQVAELSIEGKLLRRLPVEGAADLEGISHVEDDLYLLGDESAERISFVRIGADSLELRVEPTAQLTLPLDSKTNFGLEGLSWDGRNKRLYAVTEKMPLRVVGIDGLPTRPQDGAAKPRIMIWPRTGARFLLKDLSSLTVHEASGHKLLLSDESRLVVEYDPGGKPVGVLPLRKGWSGLRENVPDAEGIATGDRGELYIVSEPNLFYRFEPAL